MLGEARKLAQRLGLRRILWQVLAASSELASRGGDADMARDLGKAAAAEIQVIVSQISAHELREAYLGQPGVRSVLQSYQVD